MSYILDALRRADAERDRGAVPSLHAQQYASLPSDEEPRRGPKPIVWVVAGLSAALIAALAWNFLGHDAPRPLVAARAPDAITPAPAAVAPAPTAGVASAPAGASSANAGPSAPPAAASRPVRRVVRKADPPPNVPGAPALPLDGSRSAAAPGLRGVDIGAGVRRAEGTGGTRSADTPGGMRAADAPARPADAASADTRIYALRDLPEEIRRTLPSITVSGSTYSNDRASRMLMINGQIFHEGDVISNGLVLQQIKPRGAVFSFKGFRYEAGF